MKRRWSLSVESLETRLVPSTYNLHQGDNLQRAVHMAVPGDVILLDAGASFMGLVTLEAKANPSKLPITIATNLFPVSPGVRVGPSNASSMAQVLAPGLNQPAIQTQAGANYYTLRGLNIMPINTSVLVDTLVTIGDGSSFQTPSTVLPNNIILDQCFIHGLDGQEIKRGVALNDGGAGSKTGVYNSYVSNFRVKGQDSQAIAGWNGTGPYTIQNNYLEAAGENVLFGGAWSYIQQVPSNILISNNLISKQLSWNPKDPSYAGAAYTVKNLLELKSAKNVVIDGNTIQNNWPASQDGHAILLTPRGDQSGGSWVTVSNVTFTHNVVQNSSQGFTLLGSDDLSASQVLTNVLIQDNVFNNIKSGQIFTMGPGRSGGTRNVIIDHNTITAAYTDVLVISVHYGFQFTNNLMPQGMYGMIVDALGAGPVALAKALPDGVITGNVIVAGDAAAYPRGNFFTKTWDQALSSYPSAGARNAGTGPVATMTTISSSINPSVSGQAVSFTATVTATTPSGGTPSGSVQFVINDNPFGGPVALSNGKAVSMAATTLPASAASIKAIYTGDNSFVASTGTLTQTVSQAATTTTLAPSINPSAWGQAVTFTATVTATAPGGGTPGGSVQFLVDGSPLGSPVALSGAVAQSAATNTLTVGGHIVSAAYTGDSNFSGSTGTVTETVSQSATTTTLASSINPSAWGQAVSFTATVTAAAVGGAPSGSVQFVINGSSFGSPVALSNGKATSMAITTLPVGAATISAIYLSDNNLGGSTGTLTQTVNQATTTTSLASSAAPSAFGQAVSFTATVTAAPPGGGTPSGSVQFLIDGNAFGNSVTLSGGMAVSAATSTLAAGVHTVSAAYTGDNNFSGSTGTLTQAVDSPAVSILVMSAFPVSISAGTSASLAVTAQDSHGNTATGYRGTIHFTSSDNRATLPADYTFTAADNGVHTFSSVFATAGNQSLTATDTVNGGIASSQAGIAITPGAPNHFLVAPGVTTTVAGTAFDVSVTAQDAYNNTVSHYAGTVAFSSADPYGATLPSNYTVLATNNGSPAFSTLATLYRAGTWDITVTDKFTGITGRGNVTVTPASAVQLQVVAPVAAAPNVPFDVTVTALDPYGNVSTFYQNRLTFSTTDADPGVVLPAGAVYSASDAGTHTFTAGVTLITPGIQTITVTDADGITATATIAVIPPGMPPGGSAGQGPQEGNGRDATAAGSSSVGSAWIATHDDAGPNRDLQGQDQLARAESGADLRETERGPEQPGSASSTFSGVKEVVDQLLAAGYELGSDMNGQG